MLHLASMLKPPISSEFVISGIEHVVVVWLEITHLVHFSLLIPNMTIFRCPISSFTIFSLFGSCFLHSMFPLYVLCTSVTGHTSRFGLVVSLVIMLLVLVLCSCPITEYFLTRESHLSVLFYVHSELSHYCVFKRK